jgi:hypothetical protein
MKRIHSSNSILLMEIILNILLFCVLLVLGLQFFIQAHTKTAQTKALHQAVASCESIASLFQNGEGTLDDIADICSFSTSQNGQLHIYLDKSFTFCRKHSASYYITADLSSEKDSTLSSLRITCYTMAGQELYTMTACHYTPIRTARLDAPAKEVS